LKWFGIILICLFAVILVYALGDMPGFGEVSTAPNLHVSPDYIERSYEDTHTPNVVTSILADYRGYDTFGETTVIFTAGLVCYLLLGGWKRDGR
jgi:multicomponent Na+:H+ antiporter subunit B